MALIEIDIHPTRKQLRVFGAGWLVFFGVLAATAWWGGSGGAAVALGIVGVAVPAAGACVPHLMRIVYVAMTYLTLPIGLVVSFLVLAGVYYLVLTPTGLIMRACGRDPMARRIDRQADTYWTPRREARGAGRYFQQF